MSLFTTETKFTEEKINLFEYLFETMTLPLLVISNQKITYCNDAFVKLFGGQRKNELVSKTFLNFVHSDFKRTISSLINLNSSELKKEENFIGKLLKLNGKTLTTELRFSTTFYNDEPITIVLATDSNKFKKQELIQHTIVNIFSAVNSGFSLEELCDFLYKTISEIINVKNFYVALYDKQKQVLTFPYFKDEFNLKPESRKFGNGLTEFVIKTKSTLLLNSKEIVRRISEGLLADSKIPVKGWLGIPLFIREDIAGAIVIKEYHQENFLDDNIKDILELVSFPISRVLERAIIDEARENYTQKLQELNKAKDKFFSIISHDLKSPFNAISGFAEILKEQYSSLTKEELEQIFNSLYNSTRNINNLLNDLLQYSRFQIGLADFKPKNLKLFEIVDENLTVLKEIALSKQIKLRNNVSSVTIVYADHEMLNSILRNLINNAIKFTNTGGEIIVSASRGNDFVKISVKDNGIGISNEMISHLFNLDSKKSTLGTHKEKGTGLGLILVKEFVEKHGGQIFVDSKIGIGTEFSFTLKTSHFN